MQKEQQVTLMPSESGDGGGGVRGCGFLMTTKLNSSI